MMSPREYSGINVMGGGGGEGGSMEPNILQPKKYMDLILWTEKKIQDLNFRPKKIHDFIPFRIS